MTDDEGAPEELFRELERILKPVASDRGLMLVTLLRGWDRHVQRFVGGIQSIPIRDGVVWGVDDYAAALTMRSMIEDVRSKVPGPLVRPFDAWLDHVDCQYKDFTVPDDRGLMSRWMHRETPDQWWWHRVPRSGPVRDDLVGVG